MKGKSEFPNINTKVPDGIKPGGKPYRVVVVEDKEFQRKQIIQILESERYEIIASGGNGQEALQKIKKIDGEIDLITSNLDMPVMDGYSFIFEFNDWWGSKAKKPAIVFVSDETTKGVMQDLINMGISDFILKPIDRRLFLQRIKTSLQKRKLQQTKSL
jgi:two-component system chemotaxis response regulator CheY